MKEIQKMQRWEPWKHLKALKVHFWGFKLNHLQYPKLKNLLPKYLHFNNREKKPSQRKYASLNNEMHNYKSALPGEQYSGNAWFPNWSLKVTPICARLFFNSYRIVFVSYVPSTFTAFSQRGKEINPVKRSNHLSFSLCIKLFQRISSLYFTGKRNISHAHFIGHFT